MQSGSMAAERRLKSDLLKIHRDPPPGISASPKDSDFFKWNAIISGPENTPFEGGVFRLRLEFSKEYPYKAPVVYFFSKMFHPNVYKNGRICLDILEEEDKWSPDFDAASILSGIQAMLGDPNPESPANSEANQLFLEQPDVYDATVRRDVANWNAQEQKYDEEDEDENENIKVALKSQELEDQLNQLAIREIEEGEGIFVDSREFEEDWTWTD